MLLSLIALAIGLFFFFFYAARYYVFTAAVMLLSLFGRQDSSRNGANGNGNGGHRNGNGKPLEPGTSCVEPFVSIHLPLYNEPNVVERLLTACTTLDYNNYEVIVIDDSTDETTNILSSWAESNGITYTNGDGSTKIQLLETMLSPRTTIKIIHRTQRRGFKGGALNEAIKHMNRNAEYVIVFDADFIPPPDIIRRFLAYFTISQPTALLAEITKLDGRYADREISQEAYLSKRQALFSKISEGDSILESFQLAHQSLFELDQLFAEGAIHEKEYAVRRKPIMRELNASSYLLQSVDSKLPLRQGFTICKLFSENKIDSTDFRTRMRRISPRANYDDTNSTKDTTALFHQILNLDQELAKGELDHESYTKRRESLAFQLLTTTEDRDELKAKFDLNQRLAEGKITLEDYMAECRKSGMAPHRVVHLFSKIGNGNGSNNKETHVAVQGYQLHSLNQSENWLTQGIRAEYSGNYMIERTCEEILGAMKMIAGSVYMIRADSLRNYRWSESITEDWELTCRLYRDGNKIIYTPTIQASAECPSTIRRVIKQRQRWAEGHTYNAKRYFWSIIRSPNLTIREKLEFLYFAPYYLQSVLFVLGTSLWLISECLHEYPPLWSQTFGWTLLLSNLTALPFMNLSGLLNEGTGKKGLSGIFSSIILSYILSVFQGYAALKGLLESREGTWIRTYKTGVITESLRKIQVRKFYSSLRKGQGRLAKLGKFSLPAVRASDAQKSSHKTSKSSEDFFRLRSGVMPTILVIILSLSLIAIATLSLGVRETAAIPGNTKWYFSGNPSQGSGTDCGSTFGTLTEGLVPPGSSTLNAKNHMYCWATDRSYATGSGDAGTWDFNFVYSSNSIPSGYTEIVTIYVSPTQFPSPISTATQIGTQSITGLGTSGTISVLIPVSGVPSGSANFVQFSWFTNAKGSIVMTYNSSGSLGTSLTVPEDALAFALLAPLIPLAFRQRSTKRMSKHGDSSCSNAISTLMGERRS